jgi:outer membrane protein assembly factor BamB
VVALDRRTGAVRWRADPLEGDLSAGDAGVVAIRHGGRDLVVAPLPRGTLLLDAATGALRWRFPPPKPGFTPVYRDGHLLVSGGKYALALWRLDPDGRGATRVWEKAQMRREDPPRATAPVLVPQAPPIVVGDRVYGVKFRHTDHETWSWWCCLDAATGETVSAWRARGEGWPPPHPSFACAGGLFYLLENGPRCSLARPVADGMEVVSSFRPALRANQVYTHPVIHAGRLYLRAGGTVVCHDVTAAATAASAPAR